MYFILMIILILLLLGAMPAWPYGVTIRWVALG